MEIRISVRRLVEFILRSGSIDNRIHQASSDAMQEGSRIHRMIQKSMGSDYHAEVPLGYRADFGEYELCIEGRADGILDKYMEKPLSESDLGQQSFLENALYRPTIDEIKGTYRELRRMEEPLSLHLAQAKCYAAMYVFERHYPEINVRMTYCNMDTEEKKYFDYTYSFLEITGWFKELIESYRRWSDFEYSWEKTRTLSIKAVQFPFVYRDGQKDLAAAVYRTIVHKRKLFLEAPTGTGKTISTVFPTVKAMGEGKISRIFYLTARTITGTVAREAFDSMRKSGGLRLKSAVITARDRICFQAEDKRSCNPDVCPYANGHNDRINDAMFDLLTSEDDFSREMIVHYAQKHRVCPFEMSLDMSLFADAIICDYNYVFDPFVCLKRFFADGRTKDYCFLIDEAHNLLDRGREMYSAVLKKESFLELKRIVSEYHPRIATGLDKCNKALLELKKRCSDVCVYDSVDVFIQPLTRLSAVMSEYLEDHAEGPCRDEILKFYFDVSGFLTIYDMVDENYVMYGEYAEDGGFLLRLFNIDPSRNLSQCMAMGISSILFSATLLPIQYYKKLLSGTPDDYEIYAKSVFDPWKLGIFIGRDVTSRYSRRNAETYRRVAEYIHSTLLARSGNYLVFFPSYQFLDEVRYIYEEEFLADNDTELLIQGGVMSEEAREEFLGRFSTGNDIDLTEIIHMDMEIVEDKNVLGFCVMGGIFSEGIDLKYDSLIGVIVVGCGIPMVCNERELIRNFFEQKGMDGFDYAYRFPGMNKVLQAVGRVIRTSDDKGVALLLDERFLQGSYRSLFPREWSGCNTVLTTTVKNAEISFWSGTEPDE